MTAGDLVARADRALMYGQRAGPARRGAHGGGPPADLRARPRPPARPPAARRRPPARRLDPRRGRRARAAARPRARSSRSRTASVRGWPRLPTVDAVVAATVAALRDVVRLRARRRARRRAGRRAERTAASRRRSSRDGEPWGTLRVARDDEPWATTTSGCSRRSPRTSAPQSPRAARTRRWSGRASAPRGAAGAATRGPAAAVRARARASGGGSGWSDAALRDLALAALSTRGAPMSTAHARRRWPAPPSAAAPRPRERWDGSGPAGSRGGDPARRARARGSGRRVRRIRPGSEQLRDGRRERASIPAVVEAVRAELGVSGTLRPLD